MSARAFISNLYSGEGNRGLQQLAGSGPSPTTVIIEVQVEHARVHEHRREADDRQAGRDGPLRRFWTPRT
jgi:hypothetical protein